VRLPPADFETNPNQEVRTPSLLFVGGTPPYYHDGHVPTLAALVAQNDDRMGRTNHLSAAEQAALVAYLETL
jgi:cytochrome c peroxidase